MTRRNRFPDVWALAAAVGLAMAVSARAQQPPEPAEMLSARASQFLEGVGRGDTQAAFEELLRGSQLIADTKAVEALAAKTSQIPERFGQYRAFEQVDVKPVGKDVVLMRYLYKCENAPVVWYFTFYRPPSPGSLTGEDGTWRVISLRFDTRLESLAY